MYPFKVACVVNLWKYDHFETFAYVKDYVKSFLHKINCWMARQSLSRVRGHLFSEAPDCLHTSRKCFWPFSPTRIYSKQSCFKHAFWVSNVIKFALRLVSQFFHFWFLTLKVTKNVLYTVFNKNNLKDVVEWRKNWKNAIPFLLYCSSSTFVKVEDHQSRIVARNCVWKHYLCLSVFFLFFSVLFYPKNLIPSCEGTFVMFIMYSSSEDFSGNIYFALTKLLNKSRIVEKLSQRFNPTMPNMLINIKQAPSYESICLIL